MPRRSPTLEEPESLSPLEDEGLGKEPGAEPEDPEQPVRRRRRSSAAGLRAGASSNSSSAGGRKDADLTLIRRTFEDLFVEVGTAALQTGMLDVTGTVCVSRGPAFADRIEYLAANDPRVRKALMRFCRYGAYTGVFSIATTLSVAVAVDLGAVGRDSFAAARIRPEIDIIRAEEAQKSGSGAPVPGNGQVVRGGPPAGWPGPAGVVG